MADTVAWRAFVDLARSDAARRDREVRFDTEPPTGVVPSADDTLHLYFLCAHPELTPSSAVALTLRAVGGLTTRQIAQAYLVPESTMAQRISRAKRTVGRSGFDRLDNVRTVMRVLYLIFNEGYSGNVDLAAEAIRLTRQLASSVNDPEVHGLLALMLLHHARRPSRTIRPDGRIVPLADQDRCLWNNELIAEGIAIVQAALARDRLGEYQTQAAIAALHAVRRVSRTPTGSRSWSGTTSCCSSPTLQSSDSTVPSPSAKRRARPQDWRHSLRSTNTSRGAMRSPHISTRRTEISNSLPASMPTQPTTHPASLSATIRCAKLHDSTRSCATTSDRGGRRDAVGRRRCWLRRSHRRAAFASVAPGLRSRGTTSTECLAHPRRVPERRLSDPTTPRGIRYMSARLWGS